MKGRSKHLINRRDDFLMVRYFYHTEVKRLRFDDVLKVMSEEEFFIETQTILNRLTCLADRMKERFVTKPTLTKLKELSGNFVTDVTPKEKERYERNL
jgi:pantoate kinase